MKTNDLAGDVSNQDMENAKKNLYGKNEMGQGRANSGSPGESNQSGTHSQGKGTGMSSEANSSQTEESWQGTNGSLANEAQRKSMNQGTGNNYSNTSDDER